MAIGSNKYAKTIIAITTNRWGVERHPNMADYVTVEKVVDMYSFELEISNSHPVVCDDPEVNKADVLAMKLVSERHEKRELIDLVRWLILDKSETARKYICVN